MPGFRVFSALFLQAEIGSIDRFRSSHELAGYAGLVSTTRSSVGKTTHGGLGKANNRWLKWILVDAETGALSREDVLSPFPAREGQAQGASGCGTKAVLLSLMGHLLRIQARVFS